MHRSLSFLVPFLSLGISFASFGQDTEKVTVSQQKPLGREEYFVLKGAPATKQGPYQQYGGRKGATLLTSGFYTAGRKDSLWITYAENSQKLSQKGHYRNDEKVGVWDYYGSDGKLAQQYDHSKGKLLFSKPTMLMNGLVFSAAEEGVKLDTDPVYVEQLNPMVSYIGRNMRYPAEALRKDVQGKVWVAFTIDTKGNTTDYRVIQGLGSGCDEEALRVVKLIPTNWIPAYAGGKPVAADCLVPVSYAIR
ncbi:energy transducer TonB [Hymenobacter guriensis]|uniref:TonB family protein n=1 Tax=Hymenobacter guriensis TaxID=2793065 RepID=A0ABS0L520_9BACT|nr:energy transducer TonB [Hymenobacter guriensis]MBG8555192.1 TonB family protein [Hymenobacter guriensis]